MASSPAPNAQEQPSSASAEQSSQAVSIPAQNTSSGDGSKSTGRKELPMDFFTFSNPSYPAPVQNWQFRPTHGMGYGTQYPAAAAAMPVSAYPNSAKSTNPFDLADDSTQSQAATFPSMATLQGAFLHVGVQPQPSPFASALPPQSPPYGMTMSPVSGAYMGQQIPNNMPNPRPQGNGSSDGGEAVFASLNPIRRSGGENSTPAASKSFSPAGGNPFW